MEATFASDSNHQDDDGHGASSSSATGRWTHEEHAMFEEGLRRHGKDWKEIAAMIPTRTVIQIRTHAQKYFLRQNKSLTSSGRAEDALGTCASSMEWGSGATGGKERAGSSAATTTSQSVLDTSMAIPTSYMPRSASTSSLSSSAMLLSMPGGGGEREGEEEGGGEEEAQEARTALAVPHMAVDALMDHTEPQGKGASTGSGARGSKGSSSSSSCSSSRGGGGGFRRTDARAHDTAGAGLLGSATFHPGRGISLSAGDLEELDGSRRHWYRPASSSGGPLEDADLDLALAKMGLASPASSVPGGPQGGEAPPWLSPMTGALPHPPSSALPGYLLPAAGMGGGMGAGGGASASPKRARRVASDPIPLSLRAQQGPTALLPDGDEAGGEDEDSLSLPALVPSSSSSSLAALASSRGRGGTTSSPMGFAAVTEEDRELAGMVAQTSLLLGASGRVSPTPTAMASALPHLTQGRGPTGGGGGGGGGAGGGSAGSLSRPGSFRGDASLAALIAANPGGASGGVGVGAVVPPSPIHRSGSFRSPALSGGNGTSSPLAGVKRALPLPGGLEELPAPMMTTTVIGPNGPMVLSMHPHPSPGGTLQPPAAAARSPAVSWGKSSTTAPLISSLLALGPAAASSSSMGGGVGGAVGGAVGSSSDASSFARPPSTTSLSTTMSTSSQTTRVSAGEGGTVGGSSGSSTPPAAHTGGKGAATLGVMHRPHPSSPSPAAHATTAAATAPWGAPSMALPKPALGPGPAQASTRGGGGVMMGFVAQPAAGFE